MCPRGAIDEQRRGIDRQSHIGKLSLRDLEVRERLAESLSLLGPRYSFVERPSREAQSGRTYRRTKHVKCGESDLQPVALFPDNCRDGYAAVLKLQGSNGMWGNYVEAMDRQPLALGLNQQGYIRPLAALGITAEDYVEVGKIIVGYPGLRAIDHERIAISAYHCLHRAHI